MQKESAHQSVRWLNTSQLLKRKNTRLIGTAQSRLFQNGVLRFPWFNRGDTQLAVH